MEFTFIPAALAQDYERRKRNLATLLEKAITKTDTCWLWTHAVDNHGYGQIQVGGRAHKAHRLVWEITHGPIPVGKVIGHECNVKSCCRPSHLYLTTLAQNAHDAREDGLYPTGARHSSKTRNVTYARGDDHWTRRQPERLARGDAHHSRRMPERAKEFRRAGTLAAAVLDDEKVREMRALWATGQHRAAALAERFGVHVGQVSKVVNRRAWKEVDPAFPKPPRKLGHATLTPAQVRDARTRLAAGESRAAIGATFGVSEYAIRDIAAGRTWKHVD